MTWDQPVGPEVEHADASSLPEVDSAPVDVPERDVPEQDVAADDVADHGAGVE